MFPATALNLHPPDSIQSWVNVYWYEPLKQQYYSHFFSSEYAAICASYIKSPKYKTLYRIHVRLK